MGLRETGKDHYKLVTAVDKVQLIPLELFWGGDCTHLRVDRLKVRDGTLSNNPAPPRWRVAPGHSLLSVWGALCMGEANFHNVTENTNT